MEEHTLIVFKGKNIRRILHKDEWWFSVIDVVETLTDSTETRRYWSDLKRKLSEDEAYTELYEKIVQLKLEGSDGKKYKTDCANTETLFRIIQSIPSPQAEPFKRWLAKVGYERVQDLSDQAELENLTEDDIRLILRGDLTHHNKELATAAQDSGVVTSMDYAVFQDYGYRGLYGGFGAKDIHARKELKKNQKILDHMGSSELAANLFRATQTRDKLRRENIQGKQKANKTHFAVGSKVRDTIKELGGTMPEELLTPEKSILQLEREKVKKQLINQNNKEE